MGCACVGPDCCWCWPGVVHGWCIVGSYIVQLCLVGSGLSQCLCVVYRCGSGLVNMLCYCVDMQV